MSVDTSTVHIYDDATLLTSVSADSSGNWSKTSQTLAAGAHIIKAKAEDVAGNLGAFSTIKNIRTGDTHTPTCDLLDDSGSGSTDNVTNDSTPQIMAGLDFESVPGTASAIPVSSIASMKLYEKTGTSTYNLLLTNTTIEPTGDEITQFKTTFQIASALSEGTHTFVAAWVDQKGNESAKGTELTITVDTTAPNAPSITNINDGQVFIGTSIDISGTAS